MWSINRFLWRAIAQYGELRFHQRNRWRQSPAFMEQTGALFEAWGFSAESFKTRVVVEIGAGSRLRSRYFDGARLVAIEPLADRFIATINWSDLKEAAEVHSIPAEQFVSHLEQQAAFVMCINVLDHVFDPRAVVANAFRYLSPGGDFLLSVDMHEHGEAGLMHPVHLEKHELQEMLAASGFRVDREYEGLSPIGRASYGHGSAYTVVARRPTGERVEVTSSPRGTSDSPAFSSRGNSSSPEWIAEQGERDGE